MGRECLGFGGRGGYGNFGGGASIKDTVVMVKLMGLPSGVAEEDAITW